MTRLLSIRPAWLAVILVVVSSRQAPASAIVVGVVNYSNPQITGGQFDPSNVNGGGNTGNGFATGGTFNFTAAGGSATITFTATETVQITEAPKSTGQFPPGVYVLLAGVNGVFGDPTNPNAQLTEFSNNTSLTSFGNAIASITVGAPASTDAPVSIFPSAPGSAFGASDPFALGDGFYVLGQATTISFANLNALDQVAVDLPNISGLGPNGAAAVPEPPALLFACLLGLGLAAYSWRRCRRPAISAAG